MTTIDARVAASADDANELSSGNVQTNTTSFNVDQTGEWGAFRVSVTIPDGATIDVAYLTLQFDSSTLDEPDLTIYAEDTATPAAYSAGTGTFTISGRARTTASVNWGSTDLAAPGAFNSPSIVSIIEELMASYSYASGAYMAFMWTSRANDSTRDAQVVFYDGNTAQAPLLHIEYTEAGGGTNYDQSAAGTLTTSSTLARDTGKIVAGAVTSAGAMLKSIAKSAAGALTSAGAAVRSAGKVLAGSLGSEGALVISLTYLVAMAGTLTSEGGLLRTASKVLDGTLTSAGAAARTVGKTLAGTLTSGAILSREIAKVLAGALTSSGALDTLRAFGVAVGGTLTTGGALLRQTAKVLGGTLTSGGTLNRAIGKLVGGTLSFLGTLLATLVGSVTAHLDVALSDSAVTSITLATSAVYAVTVQDAAVYTITLSDESRS